MKRFLVLAALIGATVVVSGCSEKQQAAPVPEKAAPVSAPHKDDAGQEITSTTPQTHMKASAAKSAPKPTPTGGG